MQTQEWAEREAIVEIGQLELPVCYPVCIVCKLSEFEIFDRLYHINSHNWPVVFVIKCHDNKN